MKPLQELWWQDQQLEPLTLNTASPQADSDPLPAFTQDDGTKTFDLPDGWDDGWVFAGVFDGDGPDAKRIDRIEDPQIFDAFRFFEVDFSQYRYLGAAEERTFYYRFERIDDALYHTAFKVRGRNDPPSQLTSDTGLGTPESVGSVALSLPSYVSDIDGDPLTFSDVSVSATVNDVSIAAPELDDSLVNLFGTVRISNGAFLFLQDGEHATVTVNFSVSDGGPKPVEAHVTYEVLGRNTLPEVEISLLDSLGEDAENEATIKIVDPDDEDPDLEIKSLTVTDEDDNADPKLTGVTWWTLDEDADRKSWSLSLSPRGNFDHLGQGEERTVTISFLIDDGHGTDVALTRFLRIIGSNDAPSAPQDGDVGTPNALDLETRGLYTGVALTAMDKEDAPEALSFEIVNGAAVLFEIGAGNGIFVKSGVTLEETSYDIEVVAIDTDARSGKASTFEIAVPEKLIGSPIPEPQSWQIVPTDAEGNALDLGGQAHEVNEGESAYYKVQRTGDTSNAATLSLKLSGTATEGTDYELSADTVVLLPGESESGVVKISTMSDSEVEENESVEIVLSNGNSPLTKVETSIVDVANPVTGEWVIEGPEEINEGDKATFRVRFKPQDPDDEAPGGSFTLVFTASSDTLKFADHGNLKSDFDQDFSDFLENDLSLSGESGEGGELDLEEVKVAQDGNSFTMHVTLPSGAEGVEFDLDTKDDDYVEGLETFSIKVEDPDFGETTDKSSKNIEIVDNDQEATAEPKDKITIASKVSIGLGAMYGFFAIISAITGLIGVFRKPKTDGPPRAPILDIEGPDGNGTNGPRAAVNTSAATNSFGVSDSGSGSAALVRPSNASEAVAASDSSEPALQSDPGGSPGSPDSPRSPVVIAENPLVTDVRNLLAIMSGGTVDDVLQEDSRTVIVELDGPDDFTFEGTPEAVLKDLGGVPKGDYAVNVSQSTSYSFTESGVAPFPDGLTDVPTSAIEGFSSLVMTEDGTASQDQDGKAVEIGKKLPFVLVVADAEESKYGAVLDLKALLGEDLLPRKIARAGLIEGADLIGKNDFILQKGRTFYIPAKALRKYGAGDKLTFRIEYALESDSHYDIPSGHVVLRASGVNDPPEVRSVKRTVSENDPRVVVYLMRFVHDPDRSDKPGITSVEQTDGTPVPTVWDPVAGRFTFDPGQLASMIGEGESATLEFEYTVDDGQGKENSTATGTITIKVLGEDVVHGVNLAPRVARGVEIPATTDVEGLTVDLGEYASDPNGDPVTISNARLTDPSGKVGDVRLDTVGNAVTLSPARIGEGLYLGEQAWRLLTFDATDPAGASTPGAILIAVTGTGEKFEVETITLALDEDDAPLVTDLAAYVRQTAFDGRGEIIIDRIETNGAPLVRLGDHIAFNPGRFNSLFANDATSTVITYQARNEAGREVTGEIVYQVEGRDETIENRAPIATDLHSFASLGDVPSFLELAALVNDPDGDRLTFPDVSVSVSSGPGIAYEHEDESGRVFLETSDLSRLDAGQSATIRISYTAADKDDARDDGVIEITVTREYDLVSTFYIGEDETFEVDLDLFYAFYEDARFEGFEQLSGPAALVYTVGAEDNPFTFAFTPAATGAIDALGVGETASAAFALTYSYETPGVEGKVIGRVKLSFTIAGANDAPFVIDPKPIVHDDVYGDGVSPVLTAAQLFAGVIDPEGDPLTLARLHQTEGTPLADLRFDGTALSYTLGDMSALKIGEVETIRLAFDIEDGHGGFVSRTVTIDVHGSATGGPGNQAPRVDLNGAANAGRDATVTLTPGEAGKIAPVAEVSDRDATAVSIVELRLAQGFRAGDRLLYGILQSDAAGVLGLNSTGLGLAGIESLLRNVTFASAPGAMPGETRVIEVRVRDGNVWSEPVRSFVTIGETPENQPAFFTIRSGDTLVGDAWTMTEDERLAFRIAWQAGAPEGLTLTVDGMLALGPLTLLAGRDYSLVETTKPAGDADLVFSLLKPGIELLNGLAQGETATTKLRFRAYEDGQATFHRDVALTVAGLNDAPYGLRDIDASANRLTLPAVPSGSDVYAGVTLAASDPDLGETALLSTTIRSSVVRTDENGQTETLDGYPFILKDTDGDGQREIFADGDRLARSSVVRTDENGDRLDDLKPGTYTVWVRATDPHGSYTESAFTIDVLPPPVDISITSPDGEIREGERTQVWVRVDGGSIAEGEAVTVHLFPLTERYGSSAGRANFKDDIADIVENVTGVFKDFGSFVRDLFDGSTGTSSAPRASFTIGADDLAADGTFTLPFAVVTKQDNLREGPEWVGFGAEIRSQSGELLADDQVYLDIKDADDTESAPRGANPERLGSNTRHTINYEPIAYRFLQDMAAFGANGTTESATRIPNEDHGLAGMNLAAET